MNQATVSFMALTDDSNMGQPPQLRIPYNKEEAIAYLKKNPRNAVEVSDGEVEVVMVVWCGAAESSTNYYYGLVPLEDPNDANGGDLTAEEAIDAAVREVESGMA